MIFLGIRIELFSSPNRFLVEADRPLRFPAPSITRSPLDTHVLFVHGQPIKNQRKDLDGVKFGREKSTVRRARMLFKTRQVNLDVVLVIARPL